MSDQDDVKRAVAVINTALRHGMFPLGVMPENDADKLVEAEKLVVLCRQTKKVGDAIGPTKVQNYQAIMDVLAEADVFVGVNGDGTATPPQEVQSSPSTMSSQLPAQPQQPSVSSPPAPTTSVSAPAGQSLSPSPASSSSPPSSASPSTEQQQVPPAAPHPVDPDGILADPKVNERWEGAGGGSWLVLADQGAMVEVLSDLDGTRTVVPKGFLKTKRTEAFVAVEVDPNWNLKDQRGYNTLWYVHPGCAKWYAPLDDVPLPPVGLTVECNNCAMVLPIVSVEPNGYVPRPVGNRPAAINSEEAQGGGPVAPTTQATQPKLNEIHLYAYPDRGVKVFEHPGCSTWESETPLGGAPLPPVGVVGDCPTCGDKQVPLTKVEANGYDPATYAGPTAQPEAAAQPVFSSAQQAVVDRSTLQPVQQPSAPQETQPSAQPPQQPSPPQPPASPVQQPTPAPVTAVPSAPAQVANSPQPPSTAPPSALAAPSSPSPSTGRSTGAPVDHDEGDAEYRKILDDAEALFLPTGMPAPQDLEREPIPMPDDLTANPELNRLLHSQFNALAARARYLAKIDEKVARDCGRAVRLRLRPHMAKAKKELGASSTLTERREWAEEIGGDDVKVWLERQQFHADRADAYGEFFHIYTQDVAVLSRDLSWAQNEERGS